MKTGVSPTGKILTYLRMKFYRKTTDAVNIKNSSGLLTADLKQVSATVILSLLVTLNTRLSLGINKVLMSLGYCWRESVKKYWCENFQGIFRGFLFIPVWYFSVLIHCLTVHLTLLCIMLKNGQTYFKNVALWTWQDFLEYVWPFLTIIHQRVNMWKCD